MTTANKFRYHRVKDGIYRNYDGMIDFKANKNSLFATSGWRIVQLSDPFGSDWKQIRKER